MFHGLHDQIKLLIYGILWLHACNTTTYMFKLSIHSYNPIFTCICTSLPSGNQQISMAESKHSSHSGEAEKLRSVTQVKQRNDLIRSITQHSHLYLWVIIMTIMLTCLEDDRPPQLKLKSFNKLWRKAWKYDCKCQLRCFENYAGRRYYPKVKKSYLHHLQMNQRFIQRSQQSSFEN